jgi:hypothetical protein
VCLPREASFLVGHVPKHNASICAAECNHFGGDESRSRSGATIARAERPEAADVVVKICITALTPSDNGSSAMHSHNGRSISAGAHASRSRISRKQLGMNAMPQTKQGPLRKPESVTEPKKEDIGEGGLTTLVSGESASTAGDARGSEEEVSGKLLRHF